MAVLASAVIAIMSGNTVKAATLLLNSTTVSPTTVNLTTEGSLDWVKFVAPGFFINTVEKSGGTDISATINNPYNGESAGPVNMTWTNGTSPVSGSSNTYSIVYGAIWSGTIAADISSRTAVFYVGSDGNSPSLTLSLPGASNLVITNLGQAYTGGPLPSLYRVAVDFTADSISDVLTFNFSSGSGSGSQNSTLQGITLQPASAIPEPSSYALLVGGASILFLINRKKFVVT